MLPDATDNGCACQDIFHVIGHRGASLAAPENTLPAFKQAAEVTGFVTLDLMMTIDDRLAIMHDDYVDRTTDGHGAACRMTLAELQSLDAGSWFSKAYLNLRVPTLSEVFTSLGNSSRYLIDIKKRTGCQPMARIATKAASIVNSLGLQRKVVFSIDDEATIKLVKSLLPGVPVLASINVLYTLAPLNSMWKFVDRSDADGVRAHFLMPLLKNTMINEARTRGKKVFIYTVDSMYVSKWLECLGVDGIISNAPEKITMVSKCPVTGARSLTSTRRHREEWHGFEDNSDT